MCRVIARLNVGGPAQHVVLLARGLDPATYDSTLLAGAVGPGEREMTLNDGPHSDPSVVVERVPGLAPLASPLADLRAVWWLYRRFRRIRPDLVHTHTAKAGAVGRLAAALAGVPVRLHTYHGHVLGGGYFSAPRTAAYRFIERQLARLSHRLIALSGAQERELAERHRIAPSEKFRVVPLGLELEAFTRVDRAAARARVRRELGLDEADRVVAIVGRVVPIKNHRLLFQAISRMEDGPRPVRALVVGDGEAGLVRELQRLAESLGLASRVRWLGWRQDLPDLYAASDALAVPSIDEGTPVAVIEALATGTPVVARAVGGIPEMLRDVPCARLVGSPDPIDFATGLQSILEAPPLPEPDRARVRSAVAARHAATRLVRDIAALYEQELASAGHNPP